MYPNRKIIARNVIEEMRSSGKTYEREQDFINDFNTILRRQMSEIERTEGLPAPGRTAKTGFMDAIAPAKDLRDVDPTL